MSQADEAEWKTRKTRVDPRLRNAGWTPVALKAAQPMGLAAGHAVEEFPTDNGPADYALCDVGRVIGVVEAKKITLGPQNVLTQAERYSRGANQNPLRYGDYRVPFLYSTNGEIVWFRDVRHPLNLSRRVGGFHTPNALSELLNRDFDASCAWLTAHPNVNPRLRDYQRDATAAIERAIADRKRQMLVAMATGTGKTVTLVSQIHRLMKSGVGKRILFLVDRRALAAQAVRAFASFEAEPGLKFDKIYEVYSQRFRRDEYDDVGGTFDPKVLPEAYLTDPKPHHSFVYVSTIQRMTMNLFGRDAVFGDNDEPPDDDARQLDIPIHAFDIIVADECHRGYSAAEISTWRKTLDHFDAIKIGLTATPAAHTKAYFNEVVFRYEYERAVREGHLVDYDVVKIRSDVRMNGVFLSEGEQVGFINPRTGEENLDLLEDERQFDTSEIEEKITSPETNRKILEELKTYAEAHMAEFGRFPKTLIFAQNDLPHTSHADQLVRLAREIFGRGDDFVQKITGRVDRPLQRIREFRNRPEPGIVVSVDMLTTGVDIPDLEYLVFLRPVRSRILFEQMLGRGTRKGERHPDKSHFTVFDCFDGTLLEYFRKATAITAEPPEKESRSVRQIIEDIWQNRDRDYNVRCLVKRLQRIDKQMSGEAREQFAAVGIPDGDMAKFAASLPRRIREAFTETMTLLRKPEVQDLLVNYPRPPRTFLVGYGISDNVSSEWLVRDGTGKEYKPEDYLNAFANFVRDNAAALDAIAILLDRPRDWSTAALAELRQKLLAAPERFSIPHLQKAHELRYHKALADILSMVKHAAREEEPLYSAEERVQRALLRITEGRTFTEVQQHWLQRIRKHLVENLSIDREDFADIPILADAGGWRPADKVFGGQLAALLVELNAAVAS